jgi:hypothetical protein
MTVYRTADDADMSYVLQRKTDVAGFDIDFRIKLIRDTLRSMTQTLSSNESHHYKEGYVRQAVLQIGYDIDAIERAHGRLLRSRAAADDADAIAGGCADG